MPDYPRRGDRLEYVRDDGRVEPVTVVRRYRSRIGLFLTLRTDDGRYHYGRQEVGTLLRSGNPRVRCGWRRLESEEGTQS